MALAPDRFGGCGQSTEDGTTTTMPAIRASPALQEPGVIPPVNGVSRTTIPRVLGCPAPSEDPGALAYGERLGTALAGFSQPALPPWATATTAAAAVGANGMGSGGASGASTAIGGAAAWLSGVAAVEVDVKNNLSYSADSATDGAAAWLATAMHWHCNSKDSSLGPTPDPGDLEKLQRAFQQCIKQRRFLTSNFVWAHIKNAADCRKKNIWSLFKDKYVGMFLQGVTRMLFVVDATVQVAFATLPLVTCYDLETAILRSKAFDGISDFSEAHLGSLQHHPEVKRCMSFRENKMDHIAASPYVSSSQVLSLLMKSLETFHQDSIIDTGGAEEHGSWSIDYGLKKVALDLGVDDHTEIGLYVQRDRLLEYVIHEAQLRREFLAEETKLAVGQALSVGTLGLLEPCRCQQWHRILDHLQSLKSLSEQIHFVQELTVASIGAPEGIPDMPVAQSMNQFIRGVLAPLFMLATSAAHVTWTPQEAAGERQDPHPLAIALASLQRLLAVNGPGFDAAMQRLQSLPKAGGIPAQVLLQAERALLEMCSLQHPGQLPLSLSELLVAKPELAEAVFAKIWAEEPHAEIDEMVVLDSLTQILSTDQTDTISRKTLLETLGSAEAALCRRLNIASLHELGFRTTYGDLLAKHASVLAEVLGQFGEASPVGVCCEVSRICGQLLAAGAHEDVAAQAVLQHFSGFISASEASASVASAASHGPVEAAGPEAALVVKTARAHAIRPVPSAHAQALEGTYALATRAAEHIMSVPPLVDLTDALLEWPEDFEPSLGLLCDFLRSRLFNDASAYLTAEGHGQVIELRCGYFVRILSGDAARFTAALQAGDPCAAASSALACWLQAGAEFSSEELETVVAHQYQVWPTNVRDAFMLAATTALPREIRGSLSRIFVEPYLQSNAARGSLLREALASAEYTAVLRWMGRHFGIVAWQGAEWKATYGLAVHMPQADTAGSVGQFDCKGAWGSRNGGKDREHPADQVLSPDRVPKDHPLGTDSERRWLNCADGDAAELVCKSDAPNEALCRDIAAMFAVDFDNVNARTREWSREPEDPVKRSMQQTIKAAVQRLASDLYSGEVHFLLELLQNADDCEFPDAVHPSFRVIVETDPHHLPSWTTFTPAKSPTAVLVLEHNEVGFREENVRALCNLGQSTKRGSLRKFIGAKGIGFKSVFRATSTPVVHSGLYHFHFDAQALGGLGYLIPFPLKSPETCDTMPGTRIVLPLSDSARGVDMCQRFVEDFKPELLLFLRRLECIEIELSPRGRRQIIKKECAGSTVSLWVETTEMTDPHGAPRTGPACGSEVPGNRSSVRQDEWFLHRHTVEQSGPEVVEGTSELQLAFPLGDALHTQIPQQPVFAWLPLRSYGFRFVLQADWVVPSSREALIADSIFNQKVRNSLPFAFKEAAALFAERAWKAGLAASCLGEGREHSVEAALGPEGLKAAQAELARLYRVVPVPGEAADFFAGSPDIILRELQNVHCLLARRALRKEEGPGSLDSKRVVVRRAECRQVVRLELPRQVPAVLEDCAPELEPWLNACNRYVEVGNIPVALAVALGVPRLDAAVAFDVLECMARTDAKARARSDSEIRLIHFLFMLLACNQRANAHAHVERLKAMSVIPLATGMLFAAKEGTIYDVNEEFPQVLSDFAPILDARFGTMLRPEVSVLLRLLGVQKTDSVRFLTEVLAPILTDERNTPTQQMLITCTRAARRWMGPMGALSGQQLERVWHCLRSGMWVYVEDALTNTCSLVRLGPNTSLHVSKLPSSVDTAVRMPWLVPAAAYSEQDATDDTSPALSWMEFWGELGAWPAFAVVPVGNDGCEDGDAVPQSPELRAMLGAMRCLPKQKAHELAVDMVRFLAPHGQVYAKYLRGKCRGSSQSLAGMLCTWPWLPCVGGAVLPPDQGWLPPRPADGLEKECCFDRCVGPLRQEWPDLNISEKPRAMGVIWVLESLASNQYPKHSISEMTQLYGTLAKACHFDEHGSVEALRRLREMPWIFVPDPVPLTVKEDGKQRRELRRFNKDYPGAFYAPEQCAFRDAADLLDGWSRGVTDGMGKLARDGAQLRIVGQFYFSPNSNFSWVDRRYRRRDRSYGCVFTKDQERIHELFSSSGVKRETTWDDNLAVLREVHRRIEDHDARHGRDSINKESQARHDMQKAVDRIVGLLGLHVQQELDGKEEEDSDREHGDDEASDVGESEPRPACPGAESGNHPLRISSEKHCSDTLAKFMDGSSHLRIAWTASNVWRPLRQVFFWDDSESSWLQPCAVHELAVCFSPEGYTRKRERAISGWACCGLKPLSEHAASEAIIPRPLQGRQPDLMRGALLAAVRATSESAIKREAEQAFRTLWQVGCAMTSWQVDSAFAVRDTFALDATIASGAGILADRDVQLGHSRIFWAKHIDRASNWAVVARAQEVKTTDFFAGYMDLDKSAAPICAFRGPSRDALLRGSPNHELADVAVATTRRLLEDRGLAHGNATYLKDVGSKLEQHLWKIAKHLPEHLANHDIHAVVLAVERAATLADLDRPPKGFRKELDIASALQEKPSKVWQRLCGGDQAEQADQDSPEGGKSSKQRVNADTSGRDSGDQDPWTYGCDPWSAARQASETSCEEETEFANGEELDDKFKAAHAQTEEGPGEPGQQACGGGDGGRGGEGGSVDVGQGGLLERARAALEAARRPACAKPSSFPAYSPHGLPFKDQGNGTGAWAGQWDPRMASAGHGVQRCDATGPRFGTVSWGQTKEKKGSHQGHGANAVRSLSTPAPRSPHSSKPIVTWPMSRRAAPLLEQGAVGGYRGSAEHQCLGPAPHDLSGGASGTVSKQSLSMHNEASEEEVAKAARRLRAHSSPGERRLATGLADGCKRRLEGPASLATKRADVLPSASVDQLVRGGTLPEAKLQGSSNGRGGSFGTARQVRVRSFSEEPPVRRQALDGGAAGGRSSAAANRPARGMQGRHCSVPATMRLARPERHASAGPRGSEDMRPSAPAEDRALPLRTSVAWKVHQKLDVARLDTWSGDLRGPFDLLHTLWTIFFENDGHGVLHGNTPPWAGAPVDDETPVDNVSFTHDCIRGRFGNGDHRGASVTELIEDLAARRVDPMTDDRLILNVVRYERTFRSLNNRRLYAIKEAQRTMGITGLRVRIRIWPLDPVTIKFVLANTTKDAGRTVVVHREGSASCHAHMQASRASGQADGQAGSQVSPACPA